MTRVAAVQMVSGPEVSANLEAAAHLIGEAVASGARFIVLPENFAMMPMNDGDRLAIAEADGDGPVQHFLGLQARSHGAWIVGGTLPLRGTRPDKVRAACLLYNDHGERVARYDKIHLFDVTLDGGEQYQESRSIEPGDDVVVADTLAGRVGLSVCYDVRFPELYRRMLDRGAELFVVPSAFTAVTGRAHWDTLVRARAIENQAFVIAAAQGGRHANGRETFGHSMIVDPWGEPVARLPSGAGVVAAEISREALERVRASLPSVRHRRLGA